MFLAFNGNVDEVHLHLLYRKQSEVINKIMVFSWITYFDNSIGKL